MGLASPRSLSLSISLSLSLSPTTCASSCHAAVAARRPPPRDHTTIQPKPRLRGHVPSTFRPGPTPSIL
eukprot:9482227-Pyramimonas_sp.AAC.2